MPFTHIAYIDEAGDEGFGKLKHEDRGGQSQWLLLGAAVVRQDDDRQLPSWRDQILDRFPKSQKRTLHFRDLRHEQKVVVCQEIGRRPVYSCITFSNKLTIPNSKWAEVFKQPGYLYNYMVRWLLERVTTFCHEDAQRCGMNRANLMVVFSRRGGTDYQHMREYMEYMRDGRDAKNAVRSIRWDVFDPRDIVVENHSKWAGLQVADCITSAFFHAVEPNFYGNYETRYADTLRQTVIRVDGSALNAGITPVPSLLGCRPEPHHFEFFKSFRR